MDGELEVDVSLVEAENNNNNTHLMEKYSFKTKNDKLILIKNVAYFS